MYFEGTGVPVNHANAIEHYRLGMDAGSVECISQLGLLYQKGTGVEKDVKKAVELFEKAVSLGCSLGCYYLGTLHEDGYDGILKDLSKAATFFEQAVQLEDGSSAAAKRNLARLYDKGIGVEQSHELSLQYYLEAAKFEDAWALYTLGLKYANGTGVEQDYSIAFEFYERAAKQNNAAAMSNLGYLLGESRGCAKDSVRAAEFFQQSAALGDGFGAYNCGVVFQDGKGVPVNLFKAVDYYRMAVRLKYEGAEACLGPTSKISRKLFMAGTDLEAKDKDKEAIDHFYAAAVQGHSESVRIVTALFRYGGGPEKMSYEKEMRYFKPPEAPDSTLSAAPTEILLQIFQWLHPKECVLLRHISRRIWTLFDDDSAPRHLFNFHSHFLPPADMGERHWFDKMLFQGPRAFQAAYLEMKLNTVQKVNRYYGKYISLRGSRMNTFPAVFCNWTSVTSIDLNSSGLVGPIPDSIKYFRSLKELVLSYNCFDGTEIPASMMELTQLEVLMLTQCELTGALSVEICQFLKTLKLYSLLHNRLVVPGGVRFELYYNSKQRKRRQRRKVLAEE
ncbi:hypothetical protein BJ741DRAFT_597160 [Chytriomyces cf. hyalinus JEL632]|nr:hypothetical protein BJ741DRAFT_597160 [Chytriomyces cf. hyalinus JEL632]